MSINSDKSFAELKKESVIKYYNAFWDVKRFADQVNEKARYLNTDVKDMAAQFAETCVNNAVEDLIKKIYMIKMDLLDQ